MNNKIVQVGGKYVEYKNGVLSFQVEGTHFPYSNYEPPNSNTSAFNSTRFIITSSESNTATIDYGDGNVITYAFINNEFEMRPSIPSGSATRLPIHTYTDGFSGRRNVKITIGKLDKILSITTQYVNLYGSFPAEISNAVNLESLAIIESSLSAFPVSISSLYKLSVLQLSRMGSAVENRIPDEFINMNLSTFVCSDSVNMSDVNSSNLVSFFNSPNRNLLNTLHIESCALSNIPIEIANCTNLKSLRCGSRNPMSVMSSSLNSIPSLTSLTVGGGISTNTFLQTLTSVSNLVNLIEFIASLSNKLQTELVPDLENCTKIKIYNVSGSYQTVPRLDTFVTNMYNFVNTNASKVAGNTNFRQMIITTFRAGISITPSGTYQQPAGFDLGSNNGKPASPKEMIWVLVNQYQHTFTY